ncbi:4a-hydroxytetrahydrobiopterin dehydratase [Marinobacter salinisoli]|uniref:Putative pterin-4-alpha-carbinolamine dehydratase n=1 Tax=Marinobacter salinisoli TaxID=2769486 RepID=A0ABX7MPF0_9GAMM|nr:4a-hydroxytetrahydrobiopterin dehydratase [Marinobacter salinisoli]QSP94197.1 4a-hydroxytetrahydrobiopterin dehydratase [Marinobacter salinisoli]
MSDLAKQTCDACRKSSPRVTEGERHRLHEQLPGWQIVDAKGHELLTKAYKFKNFAEALAFTNRVGALAEAENHHPEIKLEWGRATVSWWTHTINGLHKNDFILAARTDEVVGDVDSTPSE